MTTDLFAVPDLLVPPVDDDTPRQRPRPRDGHSTKFRSWRAVGLLLAAVLFLAACGAPATPEVSEAQGTATTRTITHAYGETEVPADPQRVVVLNNSLVLGTVLLLDVPVVGYTAAPFGDGILPFFDAAKVADATDVGFNASELSLEAIAAAEPDLILGSTGFIKEEIYGQLSGIAPTVAFEIFGFSPWKDALRQVAAVFQEEDRIEQGIAAYDERVARLRERLGDRVGTTVTLANLRATDDIRIYTSNWCSGDTLEQLGLVRPPGQEGDEAIRVSLELLPRLDAELLLYFVGSTGLDPAAAATAEATITANPLWGSLDAVQSGQAFQVDAAPWFTCGSLQAQNLVLDDLERLLA